MGKPKKGKKGKDDDFSDDDGEISIVKKAPTESDDMDREAPQTSKKGKKKNRRDVELDDVEQEIAAMSLQAKKGSEEKEDDEESQPATNKKEKKKKKKEMVDSEEEEDSAEVIQSPPKKSGSLSRFQMLAGMVDDVAGDDDDDEAGDKKSDNEDKGSDTVVQKNVQNKTAKKEKKGKKEKGKTAEEEDVDAILAALNEPEKKKGKKKKKGAAEEAATEEAEIPAQPPVEVVKQELKVVSIDDYESEEDTKKKKKKGKKEKDEKDEKVTVEKEDEAGSDEEGTVKTAAQKKKEKKERERLKKLQQKQKEQKKIVGTETTAASAEEPASEKVDISKESTPAPAEHPDGEIVDDDEGKDGKKKKKKKGEKEKEEKKPKNAALLAKIKEQQAKIKEEEEKRRFELEEAERREEERIRKLEEEKRLAEEKRLKKKLKKKEREERAKQEGRFLTEKQKADRARAQQLLKSIQEQGGIIPSKEEVPKIKRPFYGRKKSQKDQQKGEESEKSPSPEDDQAPEFPSAEIEVQEKAQQPEDVSQEKEEEKEEGGEVKEAWDAESGQEDEEDEEEESKLQTTAVTTQVHVKKQISEESKESDDEEESEEESDEEEETSEEESGEDDRTPYERGKEKVMKRLHAAEAKKTTDKLRAPVVCVLGHVDTGKTKILDKLRRTHVQDGEAGGITQQIGATNVPQDAILEKTKMCKEMFEKDGLRLPGLLIIDTPGHESFSNLRSRGSSLCDIAILVIDIMHGLEPQTIESINLLKARKTPFVVALNKIDRLYGWKSMPNVDVAKTIQAQTSNTKAEFDERAKNVILQLAQEGLNAKLCYENDNPKEYVSLIPTSAHSGDGMGNLLGLICKLTQTLLAKRIAYCEELQATVMEVKAIPGKGTTIDVVVVNGRIAEGQTMVVAGTEGPIVTSIRSLLIPQPMRELRVKTNDYLQPKEVYAAHGVKVCAKDLEHAMAGLPLYVAHDKDEIEYYKVELERGLEEALKSIKLSDRGVYVQASTLGSLEALLEFLRTSNIKYAGINIGPVHKKDVMKASIMLEHDPQYAVILAFDVEVKREVQELADSLGVIVFSANIIYHLFDKFTQYQQELMKKKQEEFRHVAVFPCKLKIMPQYIFNSRDPIVMGVVVQQGFVKEGTPICVPSKEFVDIGRVSSIEFNHKPVEMARAGMEVCIKIIPNPGEAPKMFGRHFDADDILVSKISRDSIDAVKDYFRKEMSKSDWILIMELKKLFEIL